MNRTFGKTLSNLRKVYLEADESPQAAALQDPALAQAAEAQPDTQPAGTSPTDASAFDAFRDVIIDLLRVVSTFSGALSRDDEEQKEALRRTIPTDVSQKIQQTITQISNADPATVANMVANLLGELAPVSTNI
jgi:hypothetical protein